MRLKLILSLVLSIFNYERKLIIIIILIVWSDKSRMTNCGMFITHNGHYRYSNNSFLKEERWFQTRFGINFWCGLLGKMYECSKTNIEINHNITHARKLTHFETKGGKCNGSIWKEMVVTSKNTISKWGITL